MRYGSGKGNAYTLARRHSDMVAFPALALSKAWRRDQAWPGPAPHAVVGKFLGY